MRRILTLLLAVALVTAASAATAQAGYKTQRFWATFRAEKTIRWVEPRWYGHTDCYHRWWTDASGKQTEVYRSTKPVKVLLYTGGLQSQSVFVKWRTWDPYDEGSTREMPGMGRIERSASRTGDWEAGTCGVRGVIIDDEGRERTTPVPAPPQDCGVRQPAVYGDLSLGTRTADLSIGSAGSDQDALMGVYRACELARPYEMQDLRWGSEVSAKLPRAALFNRDLPSVTLRGSQEAHQKFFVGAMHGLVLTTGTVRWTVTLRRAAIPVIKGRKRR